MDWLSRQVFGAPASWEPNAQQRVGKREKPGIPQTEGQWPSFSDSDAVFNAQGSQEEVPALSEFTVEVQVRTVTFSILWDFFLLNLPCAHREIRG